MYFYYSILKIIIIIMAAAEAVTQMDSVMMSMSSNAISAP
tara:strand:- start:678 stop:797 length:120 start_codon:yes stop_codon:yes gene_type:complete